MRTVLIVDDSRSDQVVAGRLLEKAEPALRVEYASDGKTALDMMQDRVPDLVLTDMVMPEMDGLDLVSNVVSKYPRVPIILMTSKGSEQLAVEALQKGASSYVPKGRLAKELVETVEDLLAVSHEERTYAQVMGCLYQNEFSFVLQNNVNLIPPLVGFVQDSTRRLGLLDETNLIRVSVALEEALRNALYHGNLELTSELRETNQDEYVNLVNTRLGKSPFRDRRIHISVALSRDDARFTIRDEGPGFDPKNVPDPTDPENLEKATGRGLLLMRTFMDDIEFNGNGNQVTMYKRASRNGEDD